MTTTQDLQCADDVREMLAEYRTTGRLIDLERILDVTLSLLEDAQDNTDADDLEFANKALEDIAQATRAWENENKTATAAMEDILLVIDRL